MAITGQLFPRAYSLEPNSLDWVRPSTWLTLPTVNSNEDKIVGLFAIFEESNFVALQIQGNYTVDWGDGLVENFNSGVVFRGWTCK